MHPIKKEYIPIHLKGPSLSDGEINVYVHFVGPIMLVGFNEDPLDWNVFSAVQDDNQSEQYLYPYIDVDASIALLINNMTTHFQYSPLAFNNFNKDSEYIDKCITDTLCPINSLLI